MRDSYTYFLIEPASNSSLDQADYNVICSIDVESNQKQQCTMEFLGENGQPKYLRILIANCDGELKDKDRQLLHQIKEHALSTLRLVYNPKININSSSFTHYIEPGQKPKFKISCEQQDSPALNKQMFKAVFKISAKKPLEHKLISEIQNLNVPIQFRYLYLYQFFELTFKKNISFLPEFNDFLESFDSEFKSLKVSNKHLKNYVHALRDRCAHIKNKSEHGVTSLSYSDTKQLQKVMPFFVKIGYTLFNKKYGDVLGSHFKIIDESET